MSKIDMHSDKLADIKKRIKASQHVAEAMYERIKFIEILTVHLHREHEERRSGEDFNHRRNVINTHWEAAKELLCSLEKADMPLKKAIEYFKSQK